MKLAAIGCAFITSAFCMQAQAQNVTIYGVLDTGIEYINNAAAKKASVVRIPINTGTAPSRWGLTGKEPLGDSWQALFTLESGLDVGTGIMKQGGRLFGRQAFVGIEGPYGTVTLGRQYSMLLQEFSQFSWVGSNIHGFGSLDPWIPNSRSDNTVAYKHSIGALNTGLSYSFGRDNSPPGGFNTPGEGTCAGELPGNASACREWSAMLSFTGDPWGVGIAYDSQYGGPGSAVNMFNGVAPLTFTSNSNRDNRLLTNLYYKTGALKMSALWEHRYVSPQTLSGASITSNQMTLEALYQFTAALSVQGLVQRIINSQQNTRATMEMVNVTYFLSKRTALYANLAFLQNSANAAYSISLGGTTPDKGTNQVGTMIGIRHSF
ncbi:porin [Herbaspirillum lusitanum]|nr:porin [Herbaspirillum lusitanum]